MAGETWWLLQDQYSRNQAGVLGATIGFGLGGIGQAQIYHGTSLNYQYLQNQTAGAYYPALGEPEKIKLRPIEELRNELNFGMGIFLKNKKEKQNEQ